MIRKLMCWFGLHDPTLREFNGKFLLIRYQIVCRYCGRTAS